MNRILTCFVGRFLFLLVAATAASAAEFYVAPNGDDGLASRSTRNFQILDALDFLAEFTQFSSTPVGRWAVRARRGIHP
jgi:hypothetical protein